jgi:hypothetical protein
LLWRDTGAAERPPEPRFFEASARFEDVVEEWREANLKREAEAGFLSLSLEEEWQRGRDSTYPHFGKSLILKEDRLKYA